MNLMPHSILVVQGFLIPLDLVQIQVRQDLKKK